jgi:hypothetical protein
MFLPDIIKDIGSIFLVACCIILSYNTGQAQGCSDAGFCTMGAMKPDQPYSRRINIKLRSMELTYYRGKTTLTPVVYSTTADFNFSLNSKNSFQVKVPYQWVHGRLANTTGAGDLSLCFTRNLKTEDLYSINFSLGSKIPVNHANKASNEGLPLPMYYQTSLGTWDAISGISVISRKWLFATGFQVPFKQSNQNEFLWGKWKSTPDSLYVTHYGRSNSLRRGVDIMVRAERNFRFARFNATIGLLPIFRISSDGFVNAQGTRINPAGSTGMAVSALISVGYSFNARTGIKFLAGKKIRILERTENLDGLTRLNVATLTYFYKF